MVAGGVSPPDTPGSHPPCKTAVPRHKLFTAFFYGRHFIPFSKKTPAAKIPSFLFYLFFFYLFVISLVSDFSQYLPNT